MQLLTRTKYVDELTVLKYIVKLSLQCQSQIVGIQCQCETYCTVMVLSQGKPAE